MRWPIRNQILVPFVATLAVAVATIAIAAAWLAARRQGQETLGQLRRVAATLGQANFPLSRNVLEQMRGLSGAEFVAIDAGRRVVASTLPAAFPPGERPDLPAARDVDTLTLDRPIAVGGVDYFAARARTAGPASLLVLYPERRWTAARRDAAWPPLAVGAATAAVMAGVSAWLARRIGRRIDAVRALFARLAEGAFEHVPAGRPLDELHDLVLSANRLSDQLREMRGTIRHTERVRLLAQLAGGLAHQLRNSLTGARMAVQLHRRRCPAAAEEDLEVALLQLALTEEQVKGLLALGRREDAAALPARGTLAELVREVERLVGPACRHGRVRWECLVPPDAGGVVLDGYDRLRTALLNLTLNAIEAAGPGGEVGLRTARDGREVLIEVRDSGPGPPPDLRDSLFDPFVTSKPEGIGLGLALARQAADDLGGSLDWTRDGGFTSFALRLPAAPPDAEPPAAADTMSAGTHSARGLPQETA